MWTTASLWEFCCGKYTHSHTHEEGGEGGAASCVVARQAKRAQTETHKILGAGV